LRGNVRACARTLLLTSSSSSKVTRRQGQGQGRKSENMFARVVVPATRLIRVRAMASAAEPWFSFAGKRAVVTGAGKGMHVHNRLCQSRARSPPTSFTTNHHTTLTLTLALTPHSLTPTPPTHSNHTTASCVDLSRLYCRNPHSPSPVLHPPNRVALAYPRAL
jgi:hypothetical protein